MGVRACGLCEWERFEEGSMYKTKLRLLGVSALVGAGLLAAGPASATELNLGGVNVSIDTTTSFGLTVRMSDIEEINLATINGGATNGTAQSDLSGTLPSGGCGSIADPNNAHTYGVACGASGTTYSRSINGDDARLNFADSGDLLSGTVKFTSDIQADITNNIRAFARVRGFYDAVLMDEGSYARKGVGQGLTDKGESKAGMHLDLLDAYVSVDSSLMGNPLNVRLGKQVINWGEATFVLGGNTVFNSLDVSALRKPGAEIKDGLLPINALYASLALPYDLNLEAYVGDSDRIKIDVGGTPFAGGDFVERGNALNEDHIFVGGGFYSGSRAPCGYTNQLTSVAHQHTMITAIKNATNCDVAIDVFARDWTEGDRAQNYYDFNTFDRGDDQDTDGDSMGVALRWYSEALNSTEFGLFYQKYQSRLPYFTYTTRGPTLGTVTAGPFGGATSRGTFPAGFKKDLDSDSSTAKQADCGNTALLGANIAAYDSVIVRDPNNYASAARTAANAVDSSLTTSYINGSGDVTLAEAIQIACIGIHGATDGTDSGSLPGGDAAALLTGMSYFSPVYGGIEGHFTYPEDIEVMGFSWNTTVLGWGIQGELAYRDEMPLQIDTDSLTAAALITACYFSMGAQNEAVFVGRSTQRHRDAGSAKCQPDEYTHKNTIEEEVYNWDIGTTATFTRSNPVVGFLGADIGVLLTEFAGVYAEDIEGVHDEYGDYLNLYKSETPVQQALLSAEGVPLASKCTTGSDLPLGSLFALDPQEFATCRPTTSSWGAVLLGRLTYNNFMGTAFNVSPTVIFRQGMEGRSPTPAGSWVENVGSVSMSLSADYQQWSGSLSYTNNYGPILYSKNKDQDYLGLSVSRAF